jgi:hypothetical protein
MTDDGFDRDLAARLRAYESRLPDAEAPAPGPPPAARWQGWPVLIAGAAAAAVAAVLLVVVVGNGLPDQPGVGGGTPSPTGSILPSAGSARPSPTPTASAQPTPPPEPLVEALRVPGPELTYVQAITSLDDGRSLAVVDAEASLGAVGPVDVGSAAIYVTDDGGAWRPVDTGSVFDNVRVRDVFAPPGDLLVAYGWRDPSPDDGPAADVMFTSPDGETWTEVDDPGPGGPMAEGPLGYLAVVRVEGDSPAAERMRIYRSANARDWQLIHETGAGLCCAQAVGVGSEGFVVLGERRTPAAGEPIGYTATAISLASADGATWHEAALTDSLETEPFLVRLTSLGGDWVAAGFTGEAPAAGGCCPNQPMGVYWSANGLDWARRATIADPLNREAFGGTGALVAAGGRLFLSGAFAAEGSNTRPSGVWTSTDASTWTMLELGDRTEVRAVRAIADDSVLMGGRVQTDDDPGDATIWTARRAFLESP